MQHPKVEAFRSRRAIERTLLFLLLVLVTARVEAFLLPSNGTPRAPLSPSISIAIRKRPARFITTILFAAKHKKDPTEEATETNPTIGSSDTTVLPDDDAPEPYIQVLELLRQAWTSHEIPPTSLARAKLIRSRRRLHQTMHGRNDTIATKEKTTATTTPSAASFTLANPRFLQKGGNPPKANVRFPELTRAVFALEETLHRTGAIITDGRSNSNLGSSSSASCTINCQAAFLPHVDSDEGGGGSPSYTTVGLGNYHGGELVVVEEANPQAEGAERANTEERIVDIRYTPIVMDDGRQQQRQWTQPFEGERFSLVWFTTVRGKKKKKKQTKAQRAAALAAQIKNKAETAAAIATRFGLVYRPTSTDVEAILEVMGDATNPPCYVPDSSWSLQGHVVLDAGAHIGTFSTYALATGALSVVAYEPEPSNAALARQNLDQQPHATLVEAALANLGWNNANTTPALVPPADASAVLVLGRRRSDGAANTWRHALQTCDTPQADAASSPSSTGNNNNVETCTVRCLDFYQVLDESKATFVKLDIEGAELTILDTFVPHAWRTVRRLVVEYSFTKRQDMAPFRRIVAALQQEGFTVTYDFQGTLLDEVEEWPGTTDALVFCSKE